MNFNAYVLEKIENRVEDGLTYSELYELLFKNKLQNDTARKYLIGIRNFLNTSKSVDKDDITAPDVFEMNENGKHTISKLVEASEEDMKSPHRVMELLGYDPMKWDLVNSKHSKWNNGVKDLYSIKCQVKPKATKVSTSAIKRILNKNNFKVKLPVYPDKKNDGNYMLEIPLMDVHFNKISRDYNVENCKEVYLKTIQDFIERSRHYDIEKVVFPIGQDFFNSDANMIGTTTKGTIQDNELEHDKMFEQGVELLISGIELIRKELNVDVEVMLVSGNHDTLLSYYAVHLLKKLYESKDLNVHVNSEMTNRKYVHYGKCLIGYSHGHKEQGRLEKENVMQIEMKEAWAETLFHEWHLGHYHSERVKEVGNIKYRIINSITGHDRWHTESGYVGALRMAQAFLWSKEKGLLEIYNSLV